MRRSVAFAFALGIVGFAALALRASPVLAGSEWRISGSELVRLENQAARVTIVRDDWGIAHVHGFSDADAVFGKVQGRAPAGELAHRAYLEQFFSRLGPADTGAIDHYYGCGDSLVRRAAMPHPTAPFSLDRNHIGGEDDQLFGAMQRAGARFAWAADALVYEDPVPERLTLRYALARAFAYGQGPTYGCATASPPDRLGVARWMVVGAGQAVVFGVAATLKWLTRAPDRAFMLDRAARGLGKVFWGGPFKPSFYGRSAPPATTADTSGKPQV